MRTWHPSPGLWIAMGVIVVIAAFCLPIFGSRSVLGPLTRNLSNAKQTGTACRLYAADFEGRFPHHLSELQPDYCPEPLRYCSLAESHEPQFDWLYFGAGFTDKDPTGLLIASPQATTVGKEHRRIIVLRDTTAKIVSEAEYQKQLAETLRQMRELRFAPPSASAPGSEKATAH